MNIDISESLLVDGTTVSVASSEENVQNSKLMSALECNSVWYNGVNG